ncbi:MAG: hypothetical protein MHM6MM_003140 [Cercozoa sp. M6MM]
MAVSEALKTNFFRQANGTLRHGKGPLRNAILCDATWSMPNELNPDTFELPRQHALRFDIDAVSTPSNLPHMAPSAELLAQWLPDVDLKNTVFLVYERRNRLFSSPRVWFTLRSFGLDAVLVPARDVAEWPDVPIELTQDTENRVSNLSRMASKSHLSFVSIEEVRDAIRTGGAQVLDARSLGRFRGSDPDPRESLGVVPGHMPNSMCLPFNSLLTENQSEMLPSEQLCEIFKKAGVDLSEHNFVSSCGSGVTAAIISLALDQMRLAGIVHPETKLKLYDGSWAEWGSRLDTEILTDLSQPE